MIYLRPRHKPSAVKAPPTMKSKKMKKTAMETFRFCSGLDKGWPAGNTVLALAAQH